MSRAATATLAALTAPQGPFLRTATLAKLAFIGLAAQAAVLWGLAGSVLLLGCWRLCARQEARTP